jgi:hypothetical protein
VTERWNAIKDEFRLRDENHAAINIMCRRQQEVAEIILKTLELWISENADDATYDKLVKVFEDADYKDMAGEYCFRTFSINFLLNCSLNIGTLKKKRNEVRGSQ